MCTEDNLIVVTTAIIIESDAATIQVLLQYFYLFINLCLISLRVVICKVIDLAE